MVFARSLVSFVDISFVLINCIDFSEMFPEILSGYPKISFKAGVNLNRSEI